MAGLGEPERAVALSADVADTERMQQVLRELVDRFGALHGLVNNAGVHHRGEVKERSPEQLGQMVDVNLRAPIMLSRMGLPYLLEAGSGFIVQVCSLAGKLGLEGSATYSATKFGLRAFTMALAEELKGTGVTVSSVNPGPIDTGFIMDEIDEVSGPDVLAAGEHGRRGGRDRACVRGGRAGGARFARDERAIGHDGLPVSEPSARAQAHAARPRAAPEGGVEAGPWREGLSVPLGGGRGSLVGLNGTNHPVGWG